MTMDTTELRKAYESVAVEYEAGGFGAPPPGEWDAGQIVGHLALNDDLLASVTSAVLDGRPARFDNRASLRPGSADGSVLRRSGARLCDLADRLTEEQAATVVPILIQDGTEIAVDQPMPWGVLLGIQASFHLPAHGEQLRALRPTT
jgi:hypothetical protein